MNTPSHRAVSHPVSMEAFRSSFHSEFVKDSELHELATSMQGELGQYFNARMNLQPKPLDQDSFGVIYDPSLPTIVVDPDHTFSGSELLGIASHDEDLRANILYVSTAIDSVSIASDEITGRSELHVQSGAAVLPDGQVVYGDFAHPIVADIIETADMAVIEQCETYGIASFHSSKNMRRFNDKNLLGTLSSNAYSYTPQRIDEDSLMKMTTTDNLVIKPSKQSQGRGVLLTDNDANVDHTKRFYSYLKGKGYEPIVERRARSYEINHPETGERLDWNVRALLSYGELVGVYVRADAWGGPVNMSLSADSISMDDFPHYFQNSDDAWQVMNALHDSAQAVAEENPSSLIGIDLTVDEDMKACLFEINNANTGGVQTIAKMENTYDDKMEVTRRILKKFIEHAPPKSDTLDTNVSRSIPLEPSFDTIAAKAYASDRQYNQLQNIDIHEVPNNDDERFGTVLALAAIHTNIRRMLNDYSGFNEAGERLLSQYPLESRRYVYDMYARLDRPSKRDSLTSYLSEYAEVFPDDFESLGLQSGLAASSMDLKLYKRTYESFKEKFADKTAHFYRFAAHSFETRFSTLTNDMNEDDKKLFNETLEGAITTYCEFGYDDTDRFLARKLDTLGINNQLSRSVSSLQVVIAYGDQRAQETNYFAYIASQEFDDAFEFYEHILDPLLPHNSEEMAGNSPERILFLTKINMSFLGAEFAIPMTIDHLRSCEIDDPSRPELMNAMADITTLDHTPDEREHMIEILMNASNATTASSSDQMPSMDSISDYSKFALLIKHIYAGNRFVAAQLVKELSHIEALKNGLDFLLDVYITNPDVNYG
ncbi:hypothetical protein EON76_04805 [bacterium]|nr:MAG: hypothetical protein EON76_04805 [bacterium]